MVELAIVLATLLGPVLAVQAQKWIERAREKKQRRIWVFRTLMATRAATLAQNHVEALNSIRIEFFGRSKALKDIIKAWETYLDHLNNFTSSQTWGERRLLLLNDLLFKMSEHLGYGFTELEIKRDIYYPQGHAQIESEQDSIRRGFADLFQGKSALPMDVKSFPVDPQVAAKQSEIQDKLLSWLKGEHSVKVQTDGGEPGARP